MKTVLHAIRILVVILLIEGTRCQDGYSEQDILRLQQLAANEAQIETITSYSTNIIQRDPNSQSISSVSVQYHLADDDKTLDNNRSDRSRIKKVYHIKNPFQRQAEENNQSQDSKASHLDNGTGASNQYAAMQYSLPPEEFLQQMRAENQYHQQQQQQSHQQQQLSTQTSSLSYTATPQPQYQFSTISTSNYDIGNQQSNQVPQLESKSLSQVYHTSSNNLNNFQYNGPNSFGLDISQSTPSPVPQFLSTPLPNNQYLATPSNTYVSSSSPMYLSSPPSMQQYVSSPLSNIQTGSPDFTNNRVTTTIGSNSLSYDNSDLHKRMQIDHYDNSAIGVRYPTHQQYQNEYPSSTLTPSSPYPENNRISWQNTLNSGVDSKSTQDFRYNNNNNNQHDSRQDLSYDNSNTETHRIGSAPAANNVYLNFVQPDYQLLNNLKSRAREYEQESQQPEYYSHGDYGWKLSGKKSYATQDGPTQANYPRYQVQQADNSALSHMDFHLDTSKTYNYDQTSKSSSEKLDAQEFAKAAARAHEHYKQQQQQQQQLENNNYPSSTQYSHNLNLGSSNNLYNNNNDKQRNKLYSEAFNQNSYSQNNQQNDLITLSPYFYSNVRENSLETKVKLPFDHDKALKNIVPIDVSNVVPNSENQVRQSSSLDSNNRYSLSNYAKDQSEQSIKQYYKPLTDSYYKDKNAIYGFNIKTKTEDTVVPDRLKQNENNQQFQGKPQSSELYYNQGMYNDNKRYTDDTSQSHYLSQLNNYQDSLQSSANVQQQGAARPLNQMTADLSSILKLNDIPLRLTQGLSADSLRLHNNNFDQNGIPTPLPVRLNQNVDNHQIDVATNILNKLMSNKPNSLTINRPELEPQNANFLSTINGFKVANPYNMDLKLVAEMLKGKPTIEESNISSLRDQFNKPVPLKLDISQLQQLLLKNENSNLGLLNTGLSSLSNPYFEIYNPSGYYQGVKYSRSQEEEENIPIADGTSTHPIGAVMEEADPINEQEASTDSELTADGDDDIAVSLTEERPKNSYTSSLRAFVERHRHPNSLLPGRHSMQRKYPKSDMGEPYPLLKPPPRTSRNRAFHNADKQNRRRHVNKPKILRIFKTEPLFEADASIEEEEKPTVTTLLKPPPVAQDKSDETDTVEDT